MSVRGSNNRIRGAVRVVCAIASTVGVIQLQGCASTLNDNRGFDRTVSSVSDREFAEGANRPPTAKTLYALARLMEAQGRHAEYEIVLARTVERYPGFGPAYLDWANLKIAQGRLDDAIAIIEQGAEYNDSDPVLANNLGMCRLMNRDYEGALEAFERAAELSPRDWRYTCNTAVALGMLGRYEECLATYRQVVFPERAHYNLAVICEARDDLERAREEYALATEFNPHVRRKTYYPPKPTAEDGSVNADLEALDYLIGR